ncbi:unnamed protein product [marine sediment metagenome]|uniref:Uncharacterized protein n=1 Tax=marine sediment metagenome TaxID=412755 RepID=X1SNS3_9ZZZZ
MWDEIREEDDTQREDDAERAYGNGAQREDDAEKAYGNGAQRKSLLPHDGSYELQGC